MRPLNLTCLIDSLVAGGAQRQLCSLAVLLRNKGAEVSFLTYRADDFFLPMLKNAGIKYRCLAGKSKAKRALKLRKVLRKGNQDVVLAFLPSPCIYAELASLPTRKWGLVVGERSAVAGSHLARFPWKRILHRVADYVCTNSHTNRLMIEHAVPRLAGRVATIYNAVDLDSFRPGIYQRKKNGPFRIVVVASHQRNKNLSGLVHAVSIVRSKCPDLSVEVSWYGDIHPDPIPYYNGLHLIQQSGLQDRVRLFPASRTLVEIYNSASAVALLSFYEGLPNVICEAMACGRPVLMSKVSDVDNLVRHGVNGFQFNPNSPDDIADTIIRFCRLNQHERDLMGKNSRAMAEKMFNSENIAASYLCLLEAAASRRKINIQHWIPEIPFSAYQTLG